MPGIFLFKEPIMETRRTTIRQIAIMQVAPDEAEAMSRLNTVWAMTMDIEHKNVLLYPLDILVDDAEEIWPRKYIDTADFTEHRCADGSEWLIASEVSADDVDAFFRTYLRGEETAA